MQGFKKKKWKINNGKMNMTGSSGPINGVKL